MKVGLNTKRSEIMDLLSISHLEFTAVQGKTCLKAFNGYPFTLRRCHLNNCVIVQFDMLQTKCWEPPYNAWLMLKRSHK